MQYLRVFLHREPELIFFRFLKIFLISVTFDFLRKTAWSKSKFLSVCFCRKSFSQICKIHQAVCQLYLYKSHDNRHYFLKLDITFQKFSGLVLGTFCLFMSQVIVQLCTTLVLQFSFILYLFVFCLAAVPCKSYDIKRCDEKVSEIFFSCLLYTSPSPRD